MCSHSVACIPALLTVLYWNWRSASHTSPLIFKCFVFSSTFRSCPYSTPVFKHHLKRRHWFGRCWDTARPPSPSSPASALQDTLHLLSSSQLTQDGTPGIPDRKAETFLEFKLNVLCTQMYAKYIYFESCSSLSCGAVSGWEKASLFLMAFVLLALTGKALPALGLNRITEVIEIPLSLQLAREQRWELSQLWIFLPFPSILK